MPLYIGRDRWPVEQCGRALPSIVDQHPCLKDRQPERTIEQEKRCEAAVREGQTRTAKRGEGAEKQ